MSAFELLEDHLLEIIFICLCASTLILRKYIAIVPFLIGSYFIYSHFYKPNNFFGEDTLLVGIPFIIISIYIYLNFKLKTEADFNTNIRLNKSEVLDHLSELISEARKVENFDSKSNERFVEILDFYEDELMSFSSYFEVYDLDLSLQNYLRPLTDHCSKIFDHLEQFDDEKLSKIENDFQNQLVSAEEYLRHPYFNYLIKSTRDVISIAKNVQSGLKSLS